MSNRKFQVAGILNNPKDLQPRIMYLQNLTRQMPYGGNYTIYKTSTPLEHRNEQSTIKRMGDNL